MRDSQRELSQSGDYWLIGQPEGRFLERWLQGELCIAFRRKEPLGGKTVQAGLVVQALLGAGHPGWSSEQKDVGCANADSDQLVVFPCSVEVMEEPKRLVPALVRFQRFDRGSLDFGKPLFAFDTFLQLRDKDRKVRVGTRSYAVSCGEGGGEEVKRSPDTVDDRADLGVEDRVKRFHRDGCQELIAGVRIALYRQVIRAFPVPGREFLVEDWDLGFGPID